MRKTVRIITTVAAIALTIVIMCVGIFAATKITLNSNSSKISFTATDVSAKVQATKRMGATSQATALDIPNSGVFEPGFEVHKEYTGDINIGNIDFTNASDAFIITIQVDNTFATEVYIGAKLTVTYTDSNNYLVIATTANSNPYTSGTTHSIAAQQQVVFRISIKITQTKEIRDTIIKDGFENIPFNFSLELTRTSAPTPTTA